MPVDSYEVVRDALEAEGWSVGPRKKKGIFEAESRNARLTVVMPSGPAPQQIFAAYKRLFDVHADDADRRLAIVLTRQGLRAAENLEVDPGDRLKVNVFVVDENGRFYEAPAEVLAATGLPRGPAGWRNWLAARSGFEPVQREEHGLYSDSGFLGTIDELGPICIINTVSRVGRPTAGDAQQGLVLRHTWHLPRTPMLIGGAPPSKITDAYYEGLVGDEIASLLSLALNIRCMDGGPIRVWWDREDLDGLGRPDTYYHHKPMLQPPHYGEPMIPWVARSQVNLQDSRPLLEIYGDLDEKRAVVLVRAARQFQQALWIADESPGLAWLLLVGALETAASLRTDERSGLEVLHKLRPIWAEVLETATHPKAASVIKEAARLGTSLAKVRALVAEHQPAAPPQRPTPPYAIDWDNLEELVMQIYGLRSDTVHEGLPLPAPMLDPPRPIMNPPAERPGGTIGSGDSVWTAEDMPMYLHTFAWIAGGALRNWWRSLCAD
jgi:hypothetical protein